MLAASTCLTSPAEPASPASKRRNIRGHGLSTGDGARQPGDGAIERGEHAHVETAGLGIRSEEAPHAVVRRLRREDCPPAWRRSGRAPADFVEYGNDVGRLRDRAGRTGIEQHAVLPGRMPEVEVGELGAYRPYLGGCLLS